MTESATPTAPTSGEPKADQCRFEGCTRPRVPAPSGGGRRSTYCDNPDHNKTEAWKARQEAKKREAAASGETVPDDLGRPVAMSELHARDLLPAVKQLGEQFVTRLTQLTEHLETLGDPGAAAVQIDNVQTEAAAQVAAAESARSRAERQATEAIEDRDEADAAAEDATARATTAEGTSVVLLATARAALAREQETVRRAAAEVATAETMRAVAVEEKNTAQTAAQKAEETRAQAVKDAATAREDRDTARGEAAAEERLRKTAEATAQKLNTENEALRESATQARREAAESRSKLGRAEGDLTQANRERREAVEAREKAQKQALELREQATQLREAIAAANREHALKLSHAQQSIEEAHALAVSHRDRADTIAGERDRLQAHVRRLENMLDIERGRTENLSTRVEQLLRERLGQITGVSPAAVIEAPTPKPAPETTLAAAEAELTEALKTFVQFGGAGLSRDAGRLLDRLAMAILRNEESKLPELRAGVAALNTERMKLPDTDEGHRLRTALDAYRTAYTEAEDRQETIGSDE